MPNDVNLWPLDIGRGIPDTPAAILRDQAAKLGERTGGLVTAEVTTVAEADGFTHSFYIVSPELHYRYLLFRVAHGIGLYPVTVPAPDDDADFVNNETELLAFLKRQFDAPRTRQVISTLLAQTTAA